MDEVFGAGNFVAGIAFERHGGQAAPTLAETAITSLVRQGRRQAEVPAAVPCRKTSADSAAARMTIESPDGAEAR